MITEIKPRVGQPCSLGYSQVSNVTATFHYVELVGKQPSPYQVPLVEGTHYTLDTFGGRVTLLGHPLWATLGHYRATDREEALLYKGRVTSPQYVSVTFDYHTPVEVSVTATKNGSSITLDVESSTDGDIPISVDNGRRIGTVIVPVTSGQGQHVMSISPNVPKGKYTFMADQDEKDPTWNVPKYQSVKSTTVEVD